MSKIIALQGPGDSGKTTTIKLLPEILERNGYKQEPGGYKLHGPNGDFSDVFKKGAIRVGVTSQGDNYKLVFSKLTRLISEFKCDICICACRTKDRKPPGSVAAVHSFPNHKPQFVKKTKANSADRAKVNTTDVDEIFSRI